MVAALVVCAGAGVVVGRALDDDGDATGATVPAASPTSSTSGGSTQLVSDESSSGAAAAPPLAADAHGVLDVYDVVQSVTPSIVTISATISDGQVTGEAVGTGVVLTSDGEILTNNHVVDGATDVRVRFAGDTEPTAATVVATDAANDLALLKVAVDRDLQAVTFADPADIRIGDQVMAIGYALDLDGAPTVTTGIISATDRTMLEANGALDGLIQTDAAISSGNSGGPLVNALGQVVGINTAVITSDGEVAATNLGFAIGSGEVQRVLEQLRSGKAREEGYLGITPADRTDGGQGALVVEVAGSSPASNAGIQVGDVVVQVDESPVTGSAGLVAAIRDHAPGDQVPIVVVRNGEQQTITVTLDART